jgi:hypothetical protein
MDLVGPLVKTARGHQYILVIVDYGTRYPEAIPLRMVAAKGIARELFQLFELLYGRRPRGLLDLAKAVWKDHPLRSVVEHVEERMTAIWPMVREHMAQVQRAQERVYNLGAQPREFHPGEKVLVLISTMESKFLATWHGSYDIVERVGDVNYNVPQTGRRKPVQLYDVNLLKKWLCVTWT